MQAAEVLKWLDAEKSEDVREGARRYGIPTDDLLGVPMNALKRKAKELGRDHELAQKLWDSGSYEARTLAVFVDEPEKVTAEQMDRWANEFDSWAITDTAAFHLFDRTPYAWDKMRDWETGPEEFVRRASYALWWALTVHDKQSGDDRFLGALAVLEAAEPDERPLVKKAMDMALRATGKRNAALLDAAIATARKLAASANKDRAWVGSHALRELEKRRG